MRNCLLRLPCGLRGAVQVITTASSFNASLFAAIGSAVGLEGRAKANSGSASLTFWTPNVNIFRDPRWGRGQETPGEDPFLSSAYAAAFVGNLQGSDPTYLLASSCCKHFYAYDLELWNGMDRHHFNAIVTEQDAVDTYLPSFQSCVQRGNASSIMCSCVRLLAAGGGTGFRGAPTPSLAHPSHPRCCAVRLSWCDAALGVPLLRRAYARYNAVNGVPSCANADIMTTKARQEWGFQGYITSDW
jgi:beta-glucosidase-like glycosyl hydrolase